MVRDGFFSCPALDGLATAQSCCNGGFMHTLVQTTAFSSIFSSQPNHARFLPLSRLHTLVAQLMQLGYQCLGPTVENGAIVMRELDAPDGLPRGLQAEQAPGRYRLTRDPHNRYFAWANGPQAIKPAGFAPKESLWRVERDGAGRPPV